MDLASCRIRQSSRVNAEKDTTARASQRHVSRIQPAQIKFFFFYFGVISIFNPVMWPPRSTSLPSHTPPLLYLIYIWVPLGLYFFLPQLRSSFGVSNRDF
ncbi:hypothetical protein L6452_10014 [Arctium lappa]|uniref:Uncharacterized protein n=1 Tax=Arctium lappa TaxID=4217 RepID=A0ACB9DMU1_ARCLA|nr:hypothetical protein L6452_10014 [Arctium lappa]